jgi:hypothetical protein
MTPHFKWTPICKIKFLEKNVPFSPPVYLWNMKIIITEEQLTKIYSEQSIIGALASRPPVGRFNLSKAPKSSGGGRIGFPEDSPIDDLPCEYDNQERVEQLFIQDMDFNVK